MDNTIVYDSVSSAKSQWVWDYEWFQTVDIRNWKRHFRTFPGEKGWLVFPWEILKAYGVTGAHALAALWNVPRLRQHGTTNYPLEKMAYWGCISSKTLKTHVSKLTDMGAVEKGMRIPRKRVPLSLAEHVREKYLPDSDGYRLNVPKTWFTQYEDLASYNLATPLVLLAYYRFRMAHELGYCVETFETIADTIGSDSATWKRASAKLASFGLIKRAETRKGNYSVSHPSNPYDFYQSQEEKEDVGRQILAVWRQSHLERFDVEPTSGSILDAWGLYLTCNQNLGVVCEFVCRVVENDCTSDRKMSFRHVVNEIEEDLSYEGSELRKTVDALPDPRRAKWARKSN